MRRINIGLLGCGTVGTGVAKMLIENRDVIASRLGAELVLKKVADIDTATDRGVAIDSEVWTTDAFGVIDDPSIDIIVEMIGGETIAAELILAAIKSGKPVVTANKALLAGHGNDILQKAVESGVDLAFEASVGGCMPIVKTLRESLAGNRIFSMTGILNGTCNYILSTITDQGRPFEEALAEAQAKGYAEADPTLDVGGFDTAHKIAILSALSYGMRINLADVYVEGISHITPLDIEFAEQFGYRIKLLAISKDKGETAEVRVHPTMIPFDNLLSSINGTVNAVMVSADAAGDIMLYGRGAGMMPTASAVVGDLIDIARNLITGAALRIPPLASQDEHVRQKPLTPMSDIATHYYLRFFAMDRPGVLSTISGILGQHNMSIKSAYQKGRKTNGAVPLVMLTHRAREADAQNALDQITALDVVRERPVLVRIEDENSDD